jgi:lipopolysaccharide/colanic/teichoic acid biosynthesis glycosyltransferase
MRAGADKIGLSITKSTDVRITKIGAYLRKLKLDEMPQLLNVLVGEMSLVGPRPEVPKYVSLYTSEQRRVLELVPGITDLASLEFRDEEALLAAATNAEVYYREYCIPKKIELNLRHASRASIWSDIEIIFRTIVAIVTRSKPRNTGLVS